MKKRLLLMVLPLLLLCALFYVRFPRPSEAERWLWQQAAEADEMWIQSGSNWSNIKPAPDPYFVRVTDDAEIQQALQTVRCTGRLTDSRDGVADDGILGYNTSYYITLIYKAKDKKTDEFMIFPSNDRGGCYYIIRHRDETRRPSRILGWATMRPGSLPNFLSVARALALKYPNNWK